MQEGYIKLHRKILENPVVCKDSDYFAVWSYLLLNSTHKEYEALFKGKKITLKPGQLITGRYSIAKKFNISDSKVKRILTCFESDQQIDRQRSNQNSLITILNWDSYQYRDQQNDQPVTDNRPTTDQPVTTNKNVKNDKKLYIDHFDQFWNAYPKKVGKAAAHKSFVKIKVDNELIRIMVSAINAHKQSKQWSDKQFIPNPATWLNQRRWEDEIETAATDEHMTMTEYGTFKI